MHKLGSLEYTRPTKEAYGGVSNYWVGRVLLQVQASQGLLFPGLSLSFSLFANQYFVKTVKHTQ